MNIRPLHDRIVVRRIEEETKTAGGILLRVLHKKSHHKAKYSPLVMVRFVIMVTLAH